MYRTVENMSSVPSYSSRLLLRAHTPWHNQAAVLVSRHCKTGTTSYTRGIDSSFGGRPSLSATQVLHMDNQVSCARGAHCTALCCTISCAALFNPRVPLHAVREVAAHRKDGSLRLGRLCSCPQEAAELSSVKYKITEYITLGHWFSLSRSSWAASHGPKKNRDSCLFGPSSSF